MKKQNTTRGIASEKSRRQFLKLAGYGTLGLITGEFWPRLTHSAAREYIGTASETKFLPDLDI